MKKVTALFALVVVISFANATYAEVIKEGSGEYQGGKTGTYTIIRIGDGRQQINWDEYGVISSAPQGSPFYNVSYRMIGKKQVENSNYTSTGGGIFTRPNAALCSKFYPPVSDGVRLRDIHHMHPKGTSFRTPVVKFFACLDFGRKSYSCKRLSD